MQPLAPEIVRITLDGNTVELRPSLRAATRLEARIGFKAALEGIAAGSLTTMADVIEIIGDYPQAVAAVIRKIDAKGLAQLDVLKAPLIDTLMQMVELDTKTEQSKQPARKTGKASSPESLGDYFTQLYKLGTGWLGWSPEETWRATPAEIRAAYEGRVDLLKSIFGGKDSSAPAAPAAPEDLTRNIRSVFAGLGTKKVKRSA